jgi:hypothetical protein
MSAPTAPHSAALAECYRILIAAAKRAREQAQPAPEAGDGR